MSTATPDLSTLTFEQLVGWYSQIRDWTDEQRKTFEDLTKAAKLQMETIEGEIMKRFNASGIESARAGDHVAFLQRETRYRCGDWNALHDFVRQTGNFDLLQKRLSSTALATLFEETQAFPPGVTSDVERVVRVRKA